MGYRLSYTIKENINKYYKSFKIVNDEINRGDITPFIFTYLDFIKESAINLKAGLTEKSERLNVLKKGFLGNLPNGQEGKYTDLYYFLLQASLFSEIGISTKSLIENLNVSRPTLQKRLHERAKVRMKNEKALHRATSCRFFLLSGNDRSKYITVIKCLGIQGFSDFAAVKFSK